jgi:hypothetical protein
VSNTREAIGLRPDLVGRFTPAAPPVPPSGPAGVTLDLPRAAAVGRAFAVIIALLAVGNVLTQSALIFYGHDYVYGLVRLLDLDREGTLGTWYSGTALLACAAILWAITALKRRLGHRFTGHWGVLAAGFTFMAIDEVAQIHDGLVGDAIDQTVHPGGFLWAFVVPGAIISLVVLLSFVSFLSHLPRRSAWLFFVAGVIYVGGAEGLESLGGALSAAGLMKSWQYALCVLIEETMEMSGVALFIYALLDYARSTLPPLSVRLWR